MVPQESESGQVRGFRECIPFSGIGKALPQQSGIEGRGDQFCVVWGINIMLRNKQGCHA